MKDIPAQSMTALQAHNMFDHLISCFPLALTGRSSHLNITCEVDERQPGVHAVPSKKMQMGDPVSELVERLTPGSFRFGPDESRRFDQCDVNLRRGIHTCLRCWRADFPDMRFGLNEKDVAVLGSTQCVPLGTPIRPKIRERADEVFESNSLKKVTVPILGEVII